MACHRKEQFDQSNTVRVAFDFPAWVGLAVIAVAFLTGRSEVFSAER